MTVNLGTSALATAVTSLAPSLAIPPASYSLADHEPGDVLQEDERDPAPAGELDEVGALQRRLREEDAVVGEDAHRVAVQVGEAADQRLAVERLELVHHRAVDDPARSPRARRRACARRRARRRTARRGRVRRAGRLAPSHVGRPAAVQVGHDLAGDLERLASSAASWSATPERRACSVAAAQLLRASPPRRSPPSPAAGRPGRSCRCRGRSPSRRSSPARRRRRRCTIPSRRPPGRCRRPTCWPGCRRCGRSARGRGRPRPGAAGRRRRSRPGRRRAGGSAAAISCARRCFLTVSGK